MAEEEESKDKERSKYNEANLNIQRLHNCWLRCTVFRSNARYDKWKWELDTVWTELCQDVKEERLADYDKVEKENTKLRNKIGSTKNRNELYDAINERHIFLRRLQDRVGKGGTYEDESGEAMD